MSIIYKRPITGIVMSYILQNCIVVRLCGCIVVFLCTYKVAIICNRTNAKPHIYTTIFHNRTTAKPHKFALMQLHNRKTTRSQNYLSYNINI